MRRILNEHYGYLADDVRLDAYRRAIQALVTPASVVVDLGCGTGVLGWLACEAGARRVYAVDRTGMIEVARALARENGCADRITHLRQYSRDVTLAEPADLVFADQMGPLGFDADIVTDFADAAARFLAPGGRLVPSKVITWLAPAQAPSAWQVVDRWAATASGMRVNAIRLKAANTPILVGDEAGEQPDVLLLADPAPALTFTLGEPAGDVARVSLAWSIVRDGMLHGLLGWFVATLAPGITITNGPSPAPRLRRASTLLPIDPAEAVRAGDVVQAEVIAGLARQFLVWRMTVLRDGESIRVTEHTTLRGGLLSQEDLSPVDARA